MKPLNKLSVITLSTLLIGSNYSLFADTDFKESQLDIILEEINQVEEEEKTRKELEEQIKNELPEESSEVELPSETEETE